MDFDWDTYVPMHIANYWWIWVTCGVFFMPVVTALQSAHPAMQKKPVLLAYVRNSWFVWNAGLCAFSALGAYYTAPAAYHIISSTSDSCLWVVGDNTWLKAGTTGAFMFLFALSKLVEMGDTIFLAALGKPIPFIHWYHHLLTAFGCFFLIADFRPYASVGTAVNYGVHTVMYAYYALASINVKPPKSVASIITFTQTAQMVGMLGYTSYQAFMCGWTQALYITWTMYTLYLFLFLEYFVKRYLKNATKKNV